MESFVSGHASDGLWREAADRALEQLGNLPSGANLGFVYVGDTWTDEFPTIVHYLRSRTGVEHWAGTVGVGVSGRGREYHEVPALSILVGALPEGAFRLFPALRKEVEELAPYVADWPARRDAHFAIVHGDPRSAGLPKLVSDLAETLPGFLSGGVASARGRAHPQVADELTEGGLSGVLFSNAVPVVSGLTQGCTPIGPIHEITGAERNVVETLDGRPALDVFYEDIGELLARDPNRIAGYIFAGLPITGSDTGDYLVRNLVGVDTERRLLGIGDLVAPGQRMMFCRRDGNGAREDMLRMLNDVKHRLPGPPRGALYYSCLGRGPSLFGEESEELRLINEVLGEMPTAGFFCNGEISHDRLYGYTGVLTVFV